MQSDATTVEEYLDSLPEDRRTSLAKVRSVIRENLPGGYEEGMQYGMIGYYIPLSRYPDTYNGQPLSYACLANQKHYMSLYLNGVYADGSEEGWFRKAYEKTGKRLDMGKSCVRFKRVDDLPLDLIGEAISRVAPDEYIRLYERSRR
jgi:hypothetical protein